MFVGLGLPKVNHTSAARVMDGAEPLSFFL